MTDTTFVDRQTPILASWLNDVNDHVYGASVTQLNVVDTPYSADPTGVADSTTAITSCISDIVALGGGTVVFPPGNYLCGALTINNSGVKLVGAGASFFNVSTAQVQPVTLTYNGTVGGTMLTLSSVSGASNHKITDCAIMGIGFDGDSLAAKGVVVNSVNNCRFNFSATNCTDVQADFGCVADLLENTSSQHNNVEYVRVEATGVADGIRFDTVQLGGNWSKNIIGYLYAKHDDGVGVRLGNVDNLIVDLITCERAGGGTGYGLVLGAGDGVNTNNCRGNQLLCVAPGDGGLYVEGTEIAAVPSIDNTVWFLDLENASADPVLGTNAELTWGTSRGVLTTLGLVKVGIGGSHTSAITAREEALAAEFPLVISSGNGKHVEFSNGTGGKWSINISASTGGININRVGGSGGLSLQTAYLGNYVNDAAAAAGGVAVGQAYRNGSALMIRVV